MKPEKEIKAAFEALTAEHEELNTKYEQLKKTQAGSDAAYNRAASELKEVKQQLEVKTVQAGNTDLIKSRLKNLEKAYDQRVEKLELDYYVRSKCLENGVDYELIKEIPFENEEQVTFKIAQLGELLLNAKQSALNNEMAKGSKPKAGMFETGSKPTYRLSGQAGLEQEIFERLN